MTIDLALGQAVVAEQVRRVAQRDDLGMRGRVVVGDRPVVAGRDDLPPRRRVAHDDGTDRNFADQPGVLRLVERQAHRRFVLRRGIRGRCAGCA